MKASLVPIFFILFVDILGFTLIIPLLPMYAEQYGASPLQATALVSTYAVCQLVASPLLGRASDRIGRKPVLLLSQAGTFLALLCLARASTLSLIFLARAVDGGTAGNFSLAQACIADHTTAAERPRAFAFVGLAFGLGFFIGPSVTGLVASHGLRAPIYIAASLSSASILGTMFLLPGGKPAGSAADRGPSRLPFFAPLASLRGPHRAVLLSLLAQFFALAFAFQNFLAGFALYAERRFSFHGHAFTSQEVGFAFGYMGLLGIVYQGIVYVRLAPRFGEAKLLLFGFAAMAVSAAVLMEAHAVSVLVVILTLTPLGDTFVRPTLTSWLTEKADAGEQGLLLGLSQSLQSAAQIVAPLVAGFLISLRLLPEWALVSGVAACAGFVLKLRLRGTAKP